MLNTVAQIKKEFFAYRNGIVADTLRKGGDPHAFIMGCQLVDVITIASSIEHTVAMANEMWSNIQHRECRMVAPMLYPPQEMDMDQAMSWAMGVECNEIADILCHRLLRKLSFAQQLATTLVCNKKDVVKYTGWRLFLNLLISGKTIDKEIVKSLLSKEKAAQPHRDIAQLLDSIEEEL